MDIIKCESKISAVCHGCLSGDRRITALGDHSDIFLSVIGNQKQCLIYTVEDIKLCWECMAVLQKFKSFQNQLKKAQNVLMQMLYDLDLNPMTLSKLTTIKKYYYDQDIQYEHKTKRKNKEQKTLTTHQEATKDYEVTVKAENVQDEYDYMDDTFAGDASLDTIENTSDKYDIKEDLNDKITKDEDINSYSQRNEYINDVNEVESETKPVRRRRKLSQSRDNSVGYYKQYTTSIEVEQVDWGNIQSYFSMEFFGESEMEEHFLRKERKFTDYTSFPHNCKVCELGYMKPSDRKRHVNLNHHKAGSPYKCTLCNTVEPSHAALEAHWRAHTPVARCSLCGDACRPRGMKKHLNHAHTKKYGCMFCNLKFETILKFSKHYKEMHQVYICDYCNHSCKSKVLIEKHIRSKHTAITCPDCRKEYPSLRQYKRHCQDMHPNRFRLKERPEFAYCVECDKQFVSINKYKKHLKASPKHSEIKRVMIPCPDCGRIFKRKTYLNNHYNLYHANKSKHYCELCDKYFANGYGLRKHKTHVHLKVMRVKDKMCDLCGRGFATNRILLNHRRTHTGERPYKCPFCTAAFTQKQAMQSHCRTQHKDMK